MSEENRSRKWQFSHIQKAKAPKDGQKDNVYIMYIDENMKMSSIPLDNLIQKNFKKEVNFSDFSPWGKRWNLYGF